MFLIMCLVSVHAHPFMHKLCIYLKIYSDFLNIFFLNIAYIKKVSCQKVKKDKNFIPGI